MRHPWLFSGALEKPSGGFPPEGTPVEIISAERKTLAFGFAAHPEASLRVRLFAFGPQNPEDNFWEQKFFQALKLRQSIPDLLIGDTNAYRLISSEGDNIPGVVCDIYANLAAVQIRTLGAGRYIWPELKKFLATELKLDYAFLQMEESLPPQPVPLRENLSESPKLPVLIHENGLRFWVDPVKGQKTGFFLDQRENRKLVSQYCSTKKVLNTFCYTGGFSIYALKAGAAEVWSVDSSVEAMTMLEKNLEATFGSEADIIARHHSVTRDCFDFLKEAPEGYFDIIILDPPAFTKHAKTLEKAARGYKDLMLRAFKKVRAGGIVVSFSCSGHVTKEFFRQVAFGAAADANRQVRVLNQLSQPADHPINIFHPEGEYLKGLVMYVD
jgi:23S rRNA (cytosine1962-C5)-methyltransferase